MSTIYIIMANHWKNWQFCVQTWFVRSLKSALCFLIVYLDSAQVSINDFFERNFFESEFVLVEEDTDII